MRVWYRPYDSKRPTWMQDGATGYMDSSNMLCSKYCFSCCKRLQGWAMGPIFIKE